MCRKRPFATGGQGRLLVRAVVCRIPCLILCLAYVEPVCQCRAPHAPCGVHGRMALVIAALVSRPRPPPPAGLHATTPHIAAANEGPVVGPPIRNAVLRLIRGMDLRLHPCSVAPAETRRAGQTAPLAEGIHATTPLLKQKYRRPPPMLSFRCDKSSPPPIHRDPPVPGRPNRASHVPDVTAPFITRTS